MIKSKYEMFESIFGQLGSIHDISTTLYHYFNAEAWFFVYMIMAKY